MVRDRQETRDNLVNETNIPQERPLQSWKEIAAYLDRDERTAQRWEEAEGLPVRRHRGGSRSSVYAYRSELDAWRIAREPKAAEIQSEPTWWRWRVPAAIGILAVVLGALFISYGPILNPPNPLVEAAGITLRQVWTGSGVDGMGGISPDGHLLTYTDWDTGDLAIRDLETEVNRRVTDKGKWFESSEFAEFSIISPEGNRIAYSWYNEEGDYELRLLDLNRSETEVLYHCTGDEWIRPINWLPNGEKVLMGLFEDRNLVQLALVTISDGSVNSIVSSVWKNSNVTVALSPDGKYIAYDDISNEDSDQRDLFILATEGGIPNCLARHPADDYMPVWSPNGRFVLFASDRTGGTGLWMIEVNEGQPRGEPQLVKAELGPLDRFLGCTRQGALYFSLGAGMEDIYFFEIDPTSGEVLEQPTKLAGRHVGANMGPVFSPDGKYLAYHFQRAPKIGQPGAAVLVIRSLTTGEEREIPTGLTQYGPVRWFPDGESVLVPVLRSQKDRLIDYYRINLGTAETELIHKSEPNMFTCWRPDLSGDGKTIFFTEADMNDPEKVLVRFKTLDIESGQVTLLHQLPSNKRAMSIQLSPDEKTIAWVEWSQEPKFGALKIKPVEGGTTREILRLEQPEYFPLTYGFVWAPNGQYLLLSKFTGDGRKSELLKVPLEGSEPSKLGIAMNRILFGDIHKDGCRVAFYSGEQKGSGSEIWALEGFLSE